MRQEPPAALLAVPESRQVHLDVRGDIRGGLDPLGRVMAAARALGQDQVLVVRAPGEPTALCEVLESQGFAHWMERRTPDDCRVWFYREWGPGAVTVILDVRGLEPPQPMVRVLERLRALGPNEQLLVLHRQRPLMLYPQIEDQGLVHETDEPEPGLVRVLIRRPLPFG